jgi:hypothetical protein
MKELSLFPNISLSTLDKLGISYNVKETTSDYFCIIEIQDSDYEQVYNIGLEGHNKLLRGGN